MPRHLGRSCSPRRRSCAALASPSSRRRRPRAGAASPCWASRASARPRRRTRPAQARLPPRRSPCATTASPRHRLGAGRRDRRSRARAARRARARSRDAARPRWLAAPPPRASSPRACPPPVPPPPEWASRCSRARLAGPASTRWRRARATAGAAPALRRGQRGLRSTVGVWRAPYRSSPFPRRRGAPREGRAPARTALRVAAPASPSEPSNRRGVRSRRLREPLHA